MGRFLLSGGLAALVNFGSAWALRAVLDFVPWIFEISVVAGFVLGTLVSFVLNRSFTFRATDGDVRRQFLRFCAVGVGSSVAAGGVARGIAWVLGCIAYFATREPLLYAAAHAMTIGVMTVANYVLIKYVAFGRELSRRPGDVKR